MFNIKKITAVGASALMVGLTMGTAAAATFPTPFSGQSTSNVAVVTGTGSGVDDSVAAGDISEYLASRVSGGASELTGEGDTYKIEKSSVLYHLGDTITEVVSGTLDDDEFPNVLASGQFVDDNNDEFDFDQKIELEALQLTMFEDNDYIEDEPTVGFHITSGTSILNYTIDFTDEPTITDMVNSDLTIMGKTYYVLSNSTGPETLTLLDSAEDTILSNDGSTATISGKQVSVSALPSGTEVKLTVDGETTNTLGEGETQKLSDGSYVGVKDILFNAATGEGSVEFSIGKGKLELVSGSDVKVNDESVSGLKTTITKNGNDLSSIAIDWSDGDKDLFVTETSSVTMPVFENVKLSFGGLNYPVEETIEVKQGGDLYAVLEDFPLENTVEDIPFLYGDSAGAFSGIGKDSDDLVKTAFGAGTHNVTYNSSASDEYFVVSWSDGNDGESYLVRANEFDSTDTQVDFEYRVNGVWTDLKTNRDIGDTFDVGSAGAQIKLEDLKTDANNKVVWVSNATANTNFHELHSKEGMKVFLPYAAANDTSAEGAINFTSIGGAGTTGHNNLSFYLAMYEEDKDENTASGDWINVTVGWDGSATAEVEVSAVDTSTADAASTEIDDTDVERDFTYSALATEILHSKPSSGQDSVKIIYHGSEVSADVYLSEASVGVSGVEAGSLVFRDNEKSTWQNRDVVLVGGSCINSATAEALGVSAGTCEADFTAATNVGDGEYMIKSVGSAFTSGKIALVVAGYNKADTQAAASKLVNEPGEVSTDAGKEYRGLVSNGVTSAFTEVA